ncbi:MAG: diadenylate cyclase CdaA [Bacteroidales bacterium]|nr:diadenylate cyclase CdaA [Bacteroidales bacterium]MDT8430034.1 diadenylate cyclase CdaA [Bacteroidales bacterium]
MLSLFIHIRLLDIIDIFLVAWLLYQLYMLVRGTVALNIIVVIAAIYIFWWVTRALQMELLSKIIGQVIGVGVIALIIVFQQEIRRFLIYMGSRYVDGNMISLDRIFNMRFEAKPRIPIKSVLKAVMQMSQTKTGALIVIRRKSNLKMYTESAEILNSATSSRLITSIFNKTGPLHDGALVMDRDQLVAARVILPVTDKPNLPPEYGLRHRAALGMSEVTDSLIIVVSEETGQISIAENGILQKNIGIQLLTQKLEEEFGDKSQ